MINNCASSLEPPTKGIQLGEVFIKAMEGWRSQAGWREFSTSRLLKKKKALPQSLKGTKDNNAFRAFSWFFSKTLRVFVAINALIAALFFPKFVTQNFETKGFRNFNFEGFMGISDVFQIEDFIQGRV